MERNSNHGSTKKLFEILSTSNQGLSSKEARRCLALVGPNALEEKRGSPLRKFLGYFWGPIPWMIEVAAILYEVVRHWADFAIIVALLIFNANGVGGMRHDLVVNALSAERR